MPILLILFFEHIVIGGVGAYVAWNLSKTSRIGSINIMHRAVPVVTVNDLPLMWLSCDSPHGDRLSQAVLRNGTAQRPHLFHIQSSGSGAVLIGGVNPNFF